MMQVSRREAGVGALIAMTSPLWMPGRALAAGGIDVRSHGARGDGRTLDTDAINRAIAEAAGRGGGQVVFPAGRYLSFTLHLRSHVTLVLEPGAVLEAADPARHAGRYDLPEGSGEAFYQDFGHSHWRNSLICGIDVENVGIIGQGRIEGAGLTRNGPGARWRKATGERPLSMQDMDAAEIARLEPDLAAMQGLGNKAIALKNARNVVLRDFTISRGGHFAILATGCDGMTIDDLRIDTQRDGIDLDCVRNVRVTGCVVNTPNDDGIVVKSSFALGRAVPSENITISGCHVSGYDLGTMLDGRYGRTQEIAPDRDRVTGRIKLGTESNGGFRNILITDCRFERSRGLALETVDGGVLEDVIVSNIVMREVTTAPLFLRVGDRRRGPPGTGLGRMRRVSISHVDATGIDPRYAATIAGLPDSPVEEVSLSDIRLLYQGGGTQADAARVPPEVRDAYPEPSMFGTLPAYGLYARHVHGIALRDVRLEVERPDARPAVLLDDVKGARADNVTGWPG